MKRIASLATAVILLTALAAFAQGTKEKLPKSKGIVMHQASGTISSVDADKLVLSHKVKGKMEETTFLLNDQTKKEGGLKAGEKATVHYMIHDNQDIATMVKVAVAKVTAAKK